MKAFHLAKEQYYVFCSKNQMDQVRARPFTWTANGTKTKCVKYLHRTDDFINCVFKLQFSFGKYVAGKSYLKINNNFNLD